MKKKNTLSQLLLLFLLLFSACTRTDTRQLSPDNDKVRLLKIFEEKIEKQEREKRKLQKERDSLIVKAEKLQKKTEDIKNNAELEEIVVEMKNLQSRVNEYKNTISKY